MWERLRITNLYKTNTRLSFTGKDDKPRYAIRDCCPFGVDGIEVILRAFSGCKEGMQILGFVVLLQEKTHFVPFCAL